MTMVCGTYSGGVTGLNGPFTGSYRTGDVDGIKVIEFNLPYSNRDGFLKRTWIFFKYVFGSTSLILQGDHDLVFATSTPLTAGIAGIAARWLRGKPFVFEVRDLWPELPREMGVIKNPVVLGLMSALEWASYHSAHMTIGLAPGIVAGIERRGIAQDRVRFIPNACDLALFDSKQTEAWRPDGVGPSDLMAVFTGTHGIANGLDALLDAAAELKRRGRSDIKLVMIGDGKLKPELMARANREALTACVFCPPVPKTKLAGLMASSDVGLMLLANVPAFYFGTSPNKFFDYIAAGVPVLTNYPGWIAGMTSEHNCGLAVKPDDAVAFADALERLADDRRQLKVMGGNARKLAVRDFDRVHLADQFADTLEEVFSKSRSK